MKKAAPGVPVESCGRIECPLEHRISGDSPAGEDKGREPNDVTRGEVESRADPHWD